MWAMPRKKDRNSLNYNFVNVSHGHKSSLNSRILSLFKTFAFGDVHKKANNQQTKTRFFFVFVIIRVDFSLDLYISAS